MRIVLTMEEGVEGVDYHASLARAGFAPEEVVVRRPGEAAPIAFDGLVLSGGGDVAPDLYGETARGTLRDVDRRRDTQELGLIAAARRRGAPILAICRGLQVLNVACGGTLVQDIPTERPSKVNHDVSRPKDARAHGVISIGAAWLAAGSHPVNSRHHQAIDRLGDGLAAVARSEDGLVEAAEGAGMFGVQWHPENLAEDAASQGIFRHFHAAVRGRK